MVGLSIPLRYVRHRTVSTDFYYYSGPKVLTWCVRCALLVSDFYPVDGANGFVPNLIKQLCLLNFGDSIMTQLKKFLSALFLAITLASVVGCASTSKQEGTGEYIDDSAITTKVKAAIFNEATLKSAEINVETFKGVVQLSGFVSSKAAENKAVEVARSVGGVKSVKNDMRLK